MQLSYNQAYCKSAATSDNADVIENLFPTTHGRDIIQTVQSFSDETKANFYKLVLNGAEEKLVPKLNWICLESAEERAKLSDDQFICGTLNITIDGNPETKTTQKNCEPIETLPVTFAEEEEWQNRKVASRAWIRHLIQTPEIQAGAIPKK